MPSVSQKQHNLMAMVANNPAKAKQMGVPQSVGQEFVKADKGMKFGKGPESRADLQKVNKPETRHGRSQLFKEGGHVMAKNKAITNAKMGPVKTAAPSRDGVVSKGHTKGKQVKMGAAKPLGMKKGGKTK